MAKWTFSIIIGTLILLSIAGVRIYSSDYRFLLTSLPDKDIFILEYDTDDKIEILTRSSVCDYALFRITKTQFTVKCGWRKVLDAKWYLEYFKTYGTDEWVRLNRKATKVTLDVVPTEEGFLIKKVTPYYATKSRSGTAGNLIETFLVTPDKVKSSLEFQTEYTNRKWRVLWKTTPNTEVIQDLDNFIKLEKELNIFFDDVLFDYRSDDIAFYKVQKGSFVIDPLIQFGTLSESGTIGTFKYGFCDECNNLGNVSFKPSSSAFTANYESGWIDAENILRVPENISFGCEDTSGGAAHCEMTIRNGTEIIPTNDTNTITRCLFNNSLSCFGGGGFDSRNVISSGHDFQPGAIQDFDGLEVNGSTTAYLSINETRFAGTNWTGSNYTINLSKGYLDIMVKFK